MKKNFVPLFFFLGCIIVSFFFLVPQSHAQNIICNCLAPDGDGKSGEIECADQSGEATTVLCNDKKLCYSARSTDSIEFGKDTSVPIFGIGGLPQSGKKGYEVACKRPTATDTNITCKCLKPKVVGDGNNGFECSDGKKKATIYCADANDACFNEKDNPFTIGLGTMDDDTFGDVKSAKGIRCRAGADTVEPTLPLPPPPPCATELSADGKCPSFKTAFGNIQTNPEDFIVDIFGILLSISGAIALALIIRAGYTIMTSQGRPDQLQAGRDQLIAAIVGLLFLIFSFVILQTIGVDILKIPNSPTKNDNKGNTGGNGDFGGGDKNGNEDFGGGDFGN